MWKTDRRWGGMAFEAGYFPGGWCQFDQFVDLGEWGRVLRLRCRWALSIAMALIRVVPFDLVAAKCSTIFDDLLGGTYVSTRCQLSGQEGGR